MPALSSSASSLRNLLLYKASHPLSLTDLNYLITFKNLHDLSLKQNACTQTVFDGICKKKKKEKKEEEKKKMEE
jgi:hypothetical protein